MMVEATEVFNKEKYGEYIRQVPKIVEQYGGKYLARGGNVAVISGDWHPERIVLIEFGSMEKFQSWWRSPEYQAVAPLREQGAKVNAVVVEGV